MDFATLMHTMTEAAVRGDGKAAAACFAPDGVYHDVFYGAFQGGEIATMIEERFHRDAENFRWDLHEPVEQNGIGYVRYVFSYDSKMDGSKGRRVLFEGIARCELKEGKIAHYSEVANTAPGLAMLGFAPERIARIAEKQGAELKGRLEARAHIKA